MLNTLTLKGDIVVPIQLAIPLGVAGLFVLLYGGRKLLVAIGPLKGWTDYYNNSATIFGVAKRYKADTTEVRVRE